MVINGPIPVRLSLHGFPTLVIVRKVHLFATSKQHVCPAIEKFERILNLPFLFLRSLNKDIAVISIQTQKNKAA
ncbi:hypothetical protein ABK905_10760 [Acerihabitans sp. KWT182]|uniref:Uncharacterized protein n=1 Tax=Acerihabitans sp. KWT182 TaxID=3157919 RepID=A0AAU7QEL8_9GAMM